MIKFKHTLAICLLTLFAVSPVLAEPDYITDRDIRVSIEQAGTTLINDGTAVDNAEFIAQLERESADIAPPPEGSLTNEGQDIYEQAADSVIVVAGLYLCGRCDNYHANSATGFIATEDGIAVTNYHVIDNAKNATLVARTRDGRVVPVLEVLAANKADDVALIRLGGDEPYTPLPIARDAKVGQRVHTISHPSGRYYCYSCGEVARFFMGHNHGQHNIKRIQITAPFAKGSSGGPILNDAGQVIAIVTTTDSVYYNTENGQQKNLQMTFYNTVPYESILKLFGKAVD